MTKALVGLRPAYTAESGTLSNRVNSPCLQLNASFAFFTFSASTYTCPPTSSCRGVSPASIYPLASEFVERWIPGTRPGIHERHASLSSRPKRSGEPGPRGREARGQSRPWVPDTRSARSGMTGARARRLTPTPHCSSSPSPHRHTPARPWRGTWRTSRPCRLGPGMGSEPQGLTPGRPRSSPARPRRSPR